MSALLLETFIISDDFESNNTVWETRFGKICCFGMLILNVFVSTLALALGIYDGRLTSLVHANRILSRKLNEGKLAAEAIKGKDCDGASLNLNVAHIIGILKASSIRFLATTNHWVQFNAAFLKCKLVL